MMYATETERLVQENVQLKKENDTLKSKIEELKCAIHEIQAVNEIMRDDIENAVAAECGCILIEGARYSAAYQDMVGILLSNGYGVELMPIDQNRRLKLIIKESEE